jgi:putative membrane protein
MLRTFNGGVVDMKSSSRALAAALAALCVPAWAQVGDGPVAPLTAPPTIYSSSPPSAAVRPMSPAVPRIAPRPGTFAAASVPSATRLTQEAREERRFLRDTAAQSRFELDASRLAFAKSGNGAVRALAAELINHHNMLGLEVTHLLNSRGMAMPMLSNEQRKALNQLGKLGGTKFDAVYMQQVGLGQAAVARDLEKASASIRDLQLNAWIVKTLAATRFHQDMAERSMPANAQMAKWNRAPIKPQPQAMRIPAAMPQVQPPGLAAQPGGPAATIGVQPVVAR